MGDLQSTLALTTPTLLLTLMVFKSEKIMRSAMFGDCLYFQKYDLPYYIADQSLRQPMDIYIIDKTFGVRQCERTPKHIRTLDSKDLECVVYIFGWLVFPVQFLVHLLVSLSL